MNSFEMERQIRETDGDTPILFASAPTSPKDVRKGSMIEIRTVRGVGLMLVVND